MEVRSFRMLGENVGIDRMLLDINMSQMNGFDVLKMDEPKSVYYGNSCNHDFFGRTG